MSKKILITGSNGQIGHSLNLFFEDKDFDIKYTSLNVTKNHILPLDLTISENVELIFDNYKPDFIINTAGYTNVDLSENNRNIASKVNVNIVKNLLKYMPKTTKIIHISSDYIFDGFNAPYSEQDLPNPINYYGQSKLEAENLIRSSRKKYIIIRTGNLYSQFINLNSNRLTWIINSLSNNKKIFAADDMISKPTNTCTIPNIILSLLPLNDNLIINYTGQNALSIFDFAMLVAKTFNFDSSLVNKCKTDDLNFKAKRPINVSLSTDFVSDLINCNIYETEYCLNIIKDKIK